MRLKGFFYNLVGFVFEYFCDSRRLLATFAKFCLNSLFATWSYRFTRYPARALSSSPPSLTQVFFVFVVSKNMNGRWRGAWARAGWRLWDLGNGTIMLQKLFNPEWQITSKFFPFRLFLSAFLFHQPRKFPGYNLSLKNVCRGKPRKSSKRGLDRSQMEQPIKKNKFS